MVEPSRLGQADERRWLMSSGGNFSGSSCFSLLEHTPDLGIPWKEIWNFAIALKVCFFLWIAVLGKISTLDVLNRKGMYLPNICLLCYKDGESVSHVLLHCSFSMEVWTNMLQDFGMTWVFSSEVSSLFSLVGGLKPST